MKSRNLLKTCMLGFVAATGLVGLIALPAHADVVSVSRSANSASASGNSSVRQSIQQTNIQRSDGSAENIVSIQDARNNASVSGDNNHLEQNIRQENDSQYAGGDRQASSDWFSRQNAGNNAQIGGNNNRIEQSIDQSIFRR